MITLTRDKITIVELQEYGHSEMSFTTDKVKNVELFSNRIIFTFTEGSAYGVYKSNHKDMTSKEFMEVSIDIANSITRT